MRYLIKLTLASAALVALFLVPLQMLASVAGL